MPSLQTLIARRAGVAQSTVSRALANHPGIPAATKRRIHGIALQLGYTGNPLVSAVFGAMRRRQDSTSLGTFAFITAHDTRDGWKKMASYRAFLRGAVESAAQHGFAIENHWGADPQISGARLSAILEARGIHGLLIGPRSDSTQLPNLVWKNFSLVRIGLSHRGLPASCAVNHQSLTVRESAERMAARGFRRIGLILTSWQLHASDQNWLAGFLAWQAGIPVRQRVPIHLTKTFSVPELASWWKRAKPDAVLAVNANVLPLLAPNGVTRRNFALLDWHEANAELPGMNQNNELVGQAAVELLLGQIRRNEYGFPKYPQTVLIGSSWREGGRPRGET